MVRVFPPPVKVHIEDDGDSCYLFGIDEAGRVLSDSWFVTIEEAIGQAEYEYGVLPSDWKPCSSSSSNP